jgi:hypothetical protein
MFSFRHKLKKSGAKFLQPAAPQHHGIIRFKSRDRAMIAHLKPVNFSARLDLQAEFLDILPTRGNRTAARTSLNV